LVCGIRFEKFAFRPWLLVIASSFAALGYISQLSWRDNRFTENRSAHAAPVAAATETEIQILAAQAKPVSNPTELRLLRFSNSRLCHNLLCLFRLF